MEDYKSILALADMSMDNLVSVTVYCPDLKLYRTFNEVYKSYFAKGISGTGFHRIRSPSVWHPLRNASDRGEIRESRGAIPVYDSCVTHKE